MVQEGRMPSFLFGFRKKTTASDEAAAYLSLSVFVFLTVRLVVPVFLAAVFA